MTTAEAVRSLQITLIVSTGILAGAVYFGLKASADVQARSRLLTSKQAIAVVTAECRKAASESRTAQSDCSRAFKQLIVGEFRTLVPGGIPTPVPESLD